ncbi:MAG: NAD(P)/FAD-dependent oxidoreductase [Oscillochloridaceae bacterium umkhey_bin13]
MATVAIVGAGVAGLAAGRDLSHAGHQVLIFEKSRSVGGRVSTRRVANFRIDHGAQLLKTPTADLRDLAQAAGTPYAIPEPIWVFDQANQVQPGDPTLDAEPNWCWPEGNTTLAKHLARGLPVRLMCMVTTLEASAAGYLMTESNGAKVGPFDAVLLTAPAPQCIGILEASTLDPVAQAELIKALAEAQYLPCLSLALAYDQRPNPPWYALLNLDRQHAITWLACEHYKPGRAPVNCGLMLAQMSPSWSDANWDALPKGTYGLDAPLPIVLSEVQHKVAALLGADPGPLRWADVHRWRYALPTHPCGSAALEGRAQIYVAGDQEYGQGRVHLAIASGQRAAARIMADLTRSSHA